MSSAYYDQAPEEIRALFVRAEDDALVYDMLYACGLNDFGCHYLPEFDEKFNNFRVRLSKELARRIMLRIDSAPVEIRKLFQDFEQELVVDCLMMTGLKDENSFRLPDYQERVAEARIMAQGGEHRVQSARLAEIADRP